MRPIADLCSKTHTPSVHYVDGQAVMLGDALLVEGGAQAVVVGLITDQAYVPGYRATDWGYLQIGVLIDSADAGLLHYEAPHSAWTLISRA